jgi:hypothetical protein
VARLFPELDAHVVPAVAREPVPATGGSA